MLRIHKGGDAARLLGLGHDVQGHGGFAGGFRAVDLHDPAPGNAAHAQRSVQRQAASGDHGDILPRNVLAQLHHSALAVLLIQIRQGMLQGLQLGFLGAVLGGSDRLFRLGGGLLRRHGSCFLSIQKGWSNGITDSLALQGEQRLRAEKVAATARRGCHADIIPRRIREKQRNFSFVH